MKETGVPKSCRVRNPFQGTSNQIFSIPKFSGMKLMEFPPAMETAKVTITHKEYSR